MKAQTLFNEYADAVHQAVEAPVLKASAVKEGDNIIVNVGFNIMTTADQDGWQVSLQGKFAFLTNEEFSARVEKVNPESLGIVKQDLPADAKPKAVNKGQQIMVQPWSDTDLGVLMTAQEAGYVLNLGGKKKFMSDIEFRMTFNTEAAPLDKSQALYRQKPAENAKAVRYLVLPEDVTLDFKSGPFNATGGSVVYENSDDEDGYTAVPYKMFIDDFKPV